MGNGSEKWRVFIAIEIPKEIRQRIAQHIASLRDEAPDVRASWNREENVHLTLKFLGDVSINRLEVLSQAAKHSAQNLSSFPVSIEGCGAFPDHGSPGVLWIGIEDPAGALDRLYDSLEENCARAGFPREERRFNPHLTIARLRQPQGARRLADLHQQKGFEKAVFLASDLLLVRSELSSNGSRYTTLARHAFVAC